MFQQYSKCESIQNANIYPKQPEHHIRTVLNGCFLRVSARITPCSNKKSGFYINVNKKDY